MSERKRMTLEELIAAPVQVSLIFEPVEPIVVRETAEDRAPTQVGNEGGAKRMMTEEQMIARLLGGRRDKPPAPKPKPVLKVVADRKLSVAGQRERVTHEMKELIEAEKSRQLAIETHRQRMERQRAEGLYYRQLYEATAHAEYWSKQLDDPARHGHYDEMARFERELKDGV